MTKKAISECERDLFETAVCKINPYGNPLERWPDGSYKHHGINGRWEGWQMARPAAQVANKPVACDKPDEGA